MEIHRNMCSISFSYVKLYLSQRKKGVSAISKSVRNQYLEFLAETGMTRYEFSKRSGIPESTLWSLGHVFFLFLLNSHGCLPSNLSPNKTDKWLLFHIFWKVRIQPAGIPACWLYPDNTVFPDRSRISVHILPRPYPCTG